MTVEEMLQAAEGDYEFTMNRFMDNSMLYKKFVKKFLENTDYMQLCDAVERNDYQRIELHAHTLKGVAENLGFSTLYQASDALMHAMRQEQFDDIQPLHEAVKTAYEQVTANILALDK